ncbi:hypothetical protein [Streptomyces sp. 900105245]
MSSTIRMKITNTIDEVNLAYASHNLEPFSMFKKAPRHMRGLTSQEFSVTSPMPNTWGWIYFRLSHSTHKGTIGFYGRADAFGTDAAVSVTGDWKDFAVVDSKVSHDGDDGVVQFILRKAK